MRFEIQNPKIKLEKKMLTKNVLWFDAKCRQLLAMIALSSCMLDSIFFIRKDKFFIAMDHLIFVKDNCRLVAGKFKFFFNRLIYKYKATQTKILIMAIKLTARMGVSISLSVNTK